MRLARLVVVLGLAVGVAGAAGAQRRDDALTGKLVRVTAPNFAEGVVTGTVTAYTQEGLTVTEQGTGTAHLFPLRAVQRLDIFRGEDAGATAPRRARGMGFLGFALGALAGPVLAIMTDRDIVTTTLLTAGGGLVVGATAGALSGAARPGEQWTWNVSPWGYDSSLRPSAP